MFFRSSCPQTSHSWSIPIWLAIPRAFRQNIPPCLYVLSYNICLTVPSRQVVQACLSDTVSLSSSGETGTSAHCRNEVHGTIHVGRRILCRVSWSFLNEAIQFSQGSRRLSRDEQTYIIISCRGRCPLSPSVQNCALNRLYPCLRQHPCTWRWYGHGLRQRHIALLDTPYFADSCTSVCLPSIYSVFITSPHCQDGCPLWTDGRMTYSGNNRAWSHSLQWMCYHNKSIFYIIIY